MSTEISMAFADLTDAPAMREFLSAIPNGEQLGAVLEAGKPFASRAFDDDSWAAHFVVSDGRVVKCFTVRNITIDQAEMIAAASVALRPADETEFREVVLQALGPTLDADED